VLGTVVELSERNKLISVKPRETQTSSDKPTIERIVAKAEALIAKLAVIRPSL
jgi:hypothetical protein